MKNSYSINTSFAESDLASLAFQKALLQLKMGASTTILHPFLLPPDTKESEVGVVLPEKRGVVLASYEGTSGETISAGIVLADLYHKETKRKEGILVLEGGANSSEGPFRASLRCQMQEVYEDCYRENFELKNIRDSISTHTITKSYGSVHVALSLVEREESHIPFLGSSKEETKSQYTVIPVGKDQASKKILAASARIEDYDIETDLQASKRGICTKDPIIEEDKARMLQVVEEAVSLAIKSQRMPICISSDPSVSLGTIRGALSVSKEISVLHLSGEANFRPSYNGSKWDGASVMHRVSEETQEVVQVGLRSVANSEKGYLNYEKTFFNQDIKRDPLWVDDVVEELGKEVYVVIDASVFDSFVIPSELSIPDGLGYDKVVQLLKKVSKERKVIGFDFVGYQPRSGDCTGASIAAHLIYNCMGLFKK